MPEILDAALVAQSVKDNCKAEVAALKEKGITPKVGVVRVGAKGPDLSYEKSIKNIMGEADIEVEVYELDAEVSQDDYIAKFKEVNADPAVHGILAFRPLDNIDENVAIAANLDILKDVDSTCDSNMGKVVLNDPNGFEPCTAAAIMKIIDFYNIDVKGKNVVVVNNSNVIGKPVSMMLTNRFATVTITHVFTEDLPSFTQKADILITAVPVEGAIGAEHVNENTTIIDATVIRKKMVDENGEPVINEKTGRQKMQVIGCTTEEARNICKAYTPVPGLGKVTSAILAENVIKACKLQNGIEL